MGDHHHHDEYHVDHNRGGYHHHHHWNSNSTTLQYQQQQRWTLPIHKHKTQIQYAVERYGVTVIVGATGSGKSTQLPQYLREAGWCGGGGSDSGSDSLDGSLGRRPQAFQVVCTQPRRVAAISLAQRVQQETGTLPNNGAIVAHAVRFDDTSRPGVTQILYATDGTIVQQATRYDPLLSRYSVVICDEAHERQLSTDVLLGLLKRIRAQRPELRVVVCSATIDAEAFLDFFVPSSSSQPQEPSSKEPDNQHPEKKRNRWGAKVVGEGQNNNDQQLLDDPQQNNLLHQGTIISVDGRQYAVETFFGSQPVSNYLDATLDTCWKIHHHEGPGSVLCFLPSSELVDAAVRRAEHDVFAEQMDAVECLPMYGSLPHSLQARILEPPTRRVVTTSTSTTGKHNKRHNNTATKRRFIFATNIAEAAITVPDISYVVDSGLVKLPYYDPITAMERLVIGPISQASARQRAGRAGRLRPGKCFCLYTEAYYRDKMTAQTAPEVLRTNLTSLVLMLKALGVDNPLAFDFMDVPSIDCLGHALETLYALGAMDGKTHLTNLGMDLATFPSTEPRISRMLLESIAQGCAWEALAVASALQVRDLLRRPPSSNSSSSVASHQKRIDYQESVGEFADPSGDHVTYANLLSEMEEGHWTAEECRERFVNYTALRRALEIRRQLAGFLKRFGPVQAMGITDGDGTLRSRAIRKCVTAGFFFNVAKLAHGGGYRTLRKDIPVTPSAASVFTTHGGLMNTEYIIYGETRDGARGGIELTAVSTVEAQWLRELAPHYWE